MSKKIILLKTASFLLLLLIILQTPIGLQFNLQIIKTVKASPATIIVPKNFTKIQDAINNASDGDIILVEAGTYPEHVVINKTVSLVGENPATTIIDGSGTGIVVSVKASDVEIRGFTIQNGGNTIPDFGIWIASVANTTIRDNIIRNNPNGGIQLRNSTNTKIIDNLMAENYAGVMIRGNSTNNDIIGNTIANNTLGVFIDSSSFNTFYHNNFINNTKVTAYQVQILSGIGNKFDNGAEGNFWSGYVGEDLNGDGIIDTPYPDPISRWDSYPLVEPWSLIRVLDVYQNEEHYYVTIYCNSTVGYRRDNVSFFFSQPETQIRFNVTGPSGTLGFCNVTIPKNLLNATPPNNWLVRFDGTNITDVVYIYDNVTHTFFNFNYPHTTHRVQIIGTQAIPNMPPIASFTYSPPNPTILDFVNFTDTSTDPDLNGTIIRRFWDFGDGKNLTAKNTTCFHKYEKRGPYIVTLTVTDNVQATNTTTRTITVVNAAPTANFTYSPIAPIVDQKIEFTDTSTDLEGSIKERLWDFGDGNVTAVTTQFVTHTYTAAGTYNVTLTIKDDENATSTMPKTVTVRKVGTKLTLNAPSTATAKKAIVVRAILKDENNNSISDETIDFYFYENGVWKPFDSAPTNATGFASATYTPAFWGENQIMAIYNGTLKYIENNSTATVTVHPQVVTLTIDTPDALTATSGKPVKITATLKDENGAPISNATIIFYFFEKETWKTIRSTETDSNGVATIEYTPHAAGKFYIKAEFPGTQIYGKTSHVITLIVNFDYTPYILVGVAIAAIALIAFAIWRKRKKTSKI